MASTTDYSTTHSWSWSKYDGVSVRVFRSVDLENLCLSSRFFFVVMTWSHLHTLPTAPILALPVRCLWLCGSSPSSSTNMFTMPIFRFLKIGMLGGGNGVCSTCCRLPQIVHSAAVATCSLLFPSARRSIIFHSPRLYLVTEDSVDSMCLADIARDCVVLLFVTCHNTFVMHTRLVIKLRALVLPITFSDFLLRPDKSNSNHGNN